MASPRLQDRLSELRTRNFVKVAAWYVIAAWAVIQVATSTFPYLGLPAWLITAVIITAIVGFPIAIIAAWLQDRSTPETTSTTKRRGRSLTAAALIIVALAGLSVWRLNARRSASSDNAFASTTLA